MVKALRPEESIGLERREKRVAVIFTKRKTGVVEADGVGDVEK